MPPVKFTKLSTTRGTAFERRTCARAILLGPASYFCSATRRISTHEACCGFLHSLPGNGPEATHPSGTDQNFQRRLEQGGHLAIMAIFSRDGYIRFERADGNFELEIYREGVERYAPSVYRLKNIS